MRVEIKVKTNSGKTKMEEKNGTFFAFLKALPEEGKANLELMRLATKYFGKPVRIIQGKTSKRKVIEF